MELTHTQTHTSPDSLKAQEGQPVTTGGDDKNLSKITSQAGDVECSPGIHESWVQLLTPSFQGCYEIHVCLCESLFCGPSWGKACL